MIESHLILIGTFYLLDTKEDVTLNNETMPYIVTGVLTNNNRSFEFDGSLEINPELNYSNFIFDINNIGYDWKEYSGVFTMVPNRSYYIFNQRKQTYIN